MRLVGWMTGACVVSWVGVAAALGASTGVAVLCGMLGPLVVTSVTWVMAERTYRAHPERLTPLMIQAFAAKLLFFGAYVAGMIGLLPLRPVPFVVGFTVSFIVLHLTEALGLRRLFSEGTRAPR